MPRFARTQGARAPRISEQTFLESKLFDEEYYLRKYSDEIAASGMSPALHYWKIGGGMGFDPSEHFSGSRYLSEYPEVQRANMNPLLHYLLHGSHEGRHIFPVASTAAKPRAPSASAWDDLEIQLRSADQPPTLVDVVIPVYRGLHETANCIYTVLQSKLKGVLGFDVVVVDDASPEPALSRLLDDLSTRGMIKLSRNPKNVGFVGSVNIGMRLHPERDVILLNSDTEVFGDWVDRLRDAAYSGERIGTVTPFSNNATICSYPDFPRNFEGSFEVSFEDLDGLAKQANAGLTVDVPTAVGFCMYIRRECLSHFGYFDEDAFGHGYGEENDFSLRISAGGWRNVLAGNVFVRHLGRVSFQDSTDKRIAAALKIILQRYPDYLKTIAAYTRDDPPKKMRRNLDVARLRKASGEHSILFLVHSMGGGTARHVQDLGSLLASEGIGGLWLQPDLRDGNLAIVGHPQIRHLSNATTIDIKHGLQDAADLMTELGVTHIHVHHTLGFSEAITQWVPALASKCGVSYDVTIHDYYFACPRVFMIDKSERFCGNSDLQICELCVGSVGSPVGDVSVWYWRINHGAFLKGARRRFVPNPDVRTRINVFFPSLDIEVREHPEKPGKIAEPMMRGKSEPLRVAVIGAIGPHKGSRILLECAQDAAKRRLPITFYLFGYSDLSELKSLSNVIVTGKYAEAELPNLLADAKCHLAFHPAVWPETYSYTLSQGWFAGLFAVAFDIGAISQRIRQSGWGHLLPMRMMDIPAEINDVFLSLRVPPAPPDLGNKIGSRIYESLQHDYYGFLANGRSGHNERRPHVGSLPNGNRNAAVVDDPINVRTWCAEMTAPKEAMVSDASYA